ncbi:HU family DNA-binding protein [Roseicyclus persicicus]|uniref:DNA-binding protein n=1 Tax=Roseicyclus persicicus TaxID=2650661 RepID=A0A7X6H1S5_9RHOB|nr:HU family DNA-binding protein [Roseibacterium persicicum]NKX46464.1 hypothetical protein [Roseibacterium persicicum]
MATRKGPGKETVEGGVGKATPAGRTRRVPRAKVPAPKPDPAPETAAARRAHLRAVETAEAADPETAAPAAPDDGTVRRSDLIEAVAARTALKRSDAKVVIDLVLDEIGRALDRSDELALTPLGKLSVKKRKPDASGPDILTVRVRRPRDAGAEAGADGGETPLADPGEDG